MSVIVVEESESNLRLVKPANGLMSAIALKEGKAPSGWSSLPNG